MKVELIAMMPKARASWCLHTLIHWEGENAFHNIQSPLGYTHVYVQLPLICLT